MTPADIDQSLALWENRLSSAAHNLFDLQADPTYQCLTGTGGAPRTQLSGITQSRVAPALENIGTLFQCFDLLRGTIDRAVQLRRDLPALFGAEQKCREIEQLLLGKSVRIPVDQIPIAQRGLLSGADGQGCISPDGLLNSMVKAFENARDGVMAVDKAWRDLSVTLGDASRRIAALRSQDLDDSERRELEGVEHALSLRRAQVESDPLGTSLDVDSVLRPVLDRLTTAAAERAQLRTDTANGLLNAHDQLRRLSDLQRDAAAAWTEAQEKISGVDLPCPPPESKIEALKDWLDRLQQKFNAGMVRPVSIGFENWNSAAQACVSDWERIRGANSAPLELRRELRGRINALKAKAQAYGLEEDGDLRVLASQAETLLYNRPTPIDRARDAVGRYQTLLNERANQGGKTC
jgi:hypothetical protein